MQNTSPWYSERILLSMKSRSSPIFSYIWEEWIVDWWRRMKCLHFAYPKVVHEPQFRNHWPRGILAMSSLEAEIGYVKLNFRFCISINQRYITKQWLSQSRSWETWFQLHIQPDIGWMFSLNTVVPEDFCSFPQSHQENIDSVGSLK
jgi:hypothetical protein